MSRRRALVPGLWTVDSQDWRSGTAAADVVAVAGAARSGDVILLHDWVEQPRAPEALDRTATIDALPAPVRAVRERGLRFASLAPWLDGADVRFTDARQPSTTARAGRGRWRGVGVGREDLRTVQWSAFSRSTPRPEVPHEIAQSDRVVTRPGPTSPVSEPGSARHRRSCVTASPCPGTSERRTCPTPDPVARFRDRSQRYPGET
jgi:hypothetical protein